MKAFWILLLLAAGSAMSQTTEESFSVPPPLEEIHTFVEEPAEFPGGNNTALKTFVSNNLRYPQVAKEKDIVGKCWLKFVVDSEGTISDVKVISGISDCPECDQEAIRIVKMMPKWKPGKNSGKAVMSYFVMPVNFVKQ